MPKGKPTGHPTNIVCWLLGGYYDNTVWGIAYDRDNLLREIHMTHYSNPRAELQNVKILGITQLQPDDVEHNDSYELVYFQDNPDTPPAFAIYIETYSNLYGAYNEDSEGFVRQFKASKGYDLPDEYLDPKKMPGERKVVILDEGDEIKILHEKK